MTHIIEQHNIFLPTKQRIVHNLNTSDEEINVEVDNDVDMDETGTILQDVFIKHLHSKGNTLFHR
jgi:hypothetical protein